jgi:hypothetical protein
MRCLSMVLIVAALCWTGVTFSQPQDAPVNKPAPAPSLPGAKVGYGGLFDDSVKKPAAEPAANEITSESSQTPEQSTLTANADSQDEEQEPPLVLRVYDVVDLSRIDVPSYSARKLNDLGDGRSLFPEKDDPLDQSFMQGGFGMGGISGPAGGSGMNAPFGFDPIVDLITKVISPSFWDDVGGPASIQPFGELLVISTTEKHHAEIRLLLSQIREHIASRKTLVIETHWLWLTEEQLHALTPNPSGPVDEKAWEEHQKRLLQEDGDLLPGYHATISCLNGQTVSTVAGKQRRFIISLIPVVGDNGAPAAGAGSIPLNVGGANGRSVGYQPQSITIQEGAALQVRPILCGEDQVILDIHGRVVEVETPEQSVNPPSDQDAKKSAEKADDQEGTGVRAIAEAVDRPVVNTSRIDTTFRAPLGTRTLVGGITGATRPELDEPNLYLFAKVTVKQPEKEDRKSK